MANHTSDSLTTTGSVTLSKPAQDTLVIAQLSGDFTTVTFVFEGSVDGTNYFALAAIREDTGAVVNSTISPTDATTQAWKVPAEGLSKVRARVTAIATNTATFYLQSGSFVSVPMTSVQQTVGTSLGASTFTGDVTVSGGSDILFSGTTGQSEISLTDNLADALSVKIASGADLIALRTTDSDEAVVFSNNVEFFGDSGTKKVVSVGSTSVAETLTVATGEYETRLTDNLADAWSVKVAGGNDLIVVTTTDSAEAVAIKGVRHTQSTPVAITGTTTLTLMDSGGTFTVSQAAAYDIDLPSPTSGAGCRYFFHLTGAAANNVTITVAGSAATFVGTITIDGATIPATGSTLTFASGASVLGDSIEIQSLTTGLYHVRAIASGAGGITIA